MLYQHCIKDKLLVCRQVNIQAYLLWEKAGRPDGADFAQDARATLEAQLRSGKSVQDLEAALKAPEPKVLYLDVCQSLAQHFRRPGKNISVMAHQSLF